MEQSTNDTSPGTTSHVVLYHVLSVCSCDKEYNEKYAMFGLNTSNSSKEQTVLTRFVRWEDTNCQCEYISLADLYAFRPFGSHAISHLFNRVCICVCVWVCLCVRWSSVVDAFYSISYLDVILPFLLIVVIIWFIYGIVMDSIAKARSRQLKLTILCSCISSVYYFSRVLFWCASRWQLYLFDSLDTNMKRNIKWHRSAESFFFFFFSVLWISPVPLSLFLSKLLFHFTASAK